MTGPLSTFFRGAIDLLTTHRHIIWFKANSRGLWMRLTSMRDMSISGGRQPTVKERFVDLPFPTQSSRRTSILERQGRVARGINVERKNNVGRGVVRQVSSRARRRCVHKQRINLSIGWGWGSHCVSGLSNTGPLSWSYFLTRWRKRRRFLLQIVMALNTGSLINSLHALRKGHDQAMPTTSTSVIQGWRDNSAICQVSFEV